MLWNAVGRKFFSNNIVLGGVVMVAVVDSYRNLTGNPLDCGCFVAYLHGYLTRRRLESPLCHSPPEVAGRSLLSLELQDLCSENSQSGWGRLKPLVDSCRWVQF